MRVGMWVRWILLAVLGAAGASSATSKQLRWSTAGDILTFDVHAAADTLSQQVAGQVYETLVRRGKDTRLEAGLAESWKIVDPLRWRFRLRPGVRFHDGSELSADDVVFSVLRAQHPNASNKALAVRLGRPRKVDALTVDFELEAPNPVLLEHLLSAPVMSKAWCEAHGVMRPQAYVEREETPAVRQAMGTGAYRLQRYEPGVRTVLARHPRYWGSVDGAIEEVVYRPIASAATRVAALLSGDVDLVLDPPPQDVERLRAERTVKIVEGIEWRVIHLGFDQFRDELLFSSVKGRNPFKDKRVRLAFFHAIDVQALREKVMRGFSQPTGSIAYAPVSPDTERRRAHDPAQARALLSEAGYAQGFEVRLDCPNNRYVNDERICVAVSAMLARVGIRAPVHAEPMALFSPRLEKRNLSFFMLGIGGTGSDPQAALSLVAHSPDPASGDGRYNAGGFADAELDRLIEAIKREMDPARRDAMIRDALLRLNEGAYLIPLHRQRLPWAMRPQVHVVHTPWNELNLRWVTLD